MVYCMSDIHGDLEKFHSMLQLIRFSAKDTLFVIGDIIDRGPDGIEIIEEIMNSGNIIMLLGNHEKMCLDTKTTSTESSSMPSKKLLGGTI